MMKLKKEKFYILCCILTGLSAAFAFPKINLVFLMWFAFIPLIHVVYKSSTLLSFIYAFFAGFVFNAQADFWLIDTVDLFADDYVVAVIFYTMFCSYFALYWALWGAVSSALKKYCSKTWLFVVLSACLWIVIEYIRTYILGEWPWLIVGYSQYLFVYLIQIAEFTGIYGISFLIMLINGLLYFAIADKKKSYAIAALVLLSAVTAFGVSRYYSFQNFGDKKEYTAAVVQSNIEQYKKLDNSHKAETAAVLESFASELSEIGADINVWSESEIINFIPADIESYVFADRIAKTAGAFNILGAPYLDGNGRLFNAIFHFDGNGGYVAMHTKNHLVPFGEYLPVPKWLAKFLEVTDKDDDLLEGNDTNIFTSGELVAAPLICSENFFPDIVRRFVLSGAKVLTNHTNDAWFLDSSAPYKHFAANIFRAVESRKAVIVAANTGVSAIIDASGKIAVSTRVYERTLITGTFRQNDYKTFYILYGDVFMKICIIFIVVFAAVIFYKRYKAKNGAKTNL
ncbi:MAG: apolipoprotein N-acyltransferase [Endomicrobium sp.]|jgi:apolipoprotein N-acyltransferase|nr:apolipoprotein N-acyltransferase [Endomicrobium sp.]